MFSSETRITSAEKQSALAKLLGQPALAKSMAVPHYAYLKMKVPSSKGIITIAGDYKKSSECAAASSRLAESLVIAEDKKMLDRVVAMAGKQPALSPTPRNMMLKVLSSGPKKQRRYLYTRSTRRGTLS